MLHSQRRASLSLSLVNLVFQSLKSLVVALRSLVNLVFQSLKSLVVALRSLVNLVFQKIE